MSSPFVLYVNGLDALADYESIPDDVIKSARIAINKGATRGRTLAARGVLKETKFPASYVAPANGRLVVKNSASNNNLEAIISGKTRATSLSRFLKGTPTLGGARRKSGLRVEVDPTKGVRMLPAAFLIKLRSGASIDSSNNLGIAVRTTNGRPPPGYKPSKIADNLWLLAGPSVAQNLYSEKNGGGVFTDISPDIADIIEAEFWRQMKLK